jgi:hypothetical protein
MKPASLIVGDNPGVMSYGANEKSFEKTGLMEAAIRDITRTSATIP